MELKERVYGSILGGAAGDALGYEVEFERLPTIKNKYGINGIQNLSNDKAVFSDDTQMTLFTANGLLYGFTMAINRGVIGEWKDYIWLAYKDWLATQLNTTPKKKHTWLFDIKELHETRAPGSTCITAISESENGGTIENHINNSKGCGGVMRTAPIGLYLNPKYIYTEDAAGYVCRIGAEAAALTHGHPLGYIPSGYLCTLINLISYPDFYSEHTLYENVLLALDITRNTFSKEAYIEEFCAIINKSVKLAQSSISDEDAVFSLGEGWVGEETMAIAICSALRHENDFASAIRMAVNHDGDSDSTASITGNILGAFLGAKSVKESFNTQSIELNSVIEEISYDLAYAATQSDYDADIEDKSWGDKYIFCKKTKV